MSSNPVSVRLARFAEAEQLPAIERSATQAFLALPELAWVATDDTLPIEAHRHFIEIGGSWVAELEGRLVGFLCAEAYQSDLHLWEVAVERTAQGQGVGRGLIAAAEGHARGKRLRRLTLTTFRDVPWNQGLYEHLGFWVLERHQLDPRLSYVLDLEARQGLPLERRCAMARRLTGTPPLSAGLSLPSADA